LSRLASLTRTIEVRVDAATAFRLFTEEIGEWYRPGRYSWNDPERAVGIRFEPGGEGRLLELYADGTAFEMGRVLAWEPGVRLVFEYRSAFLPPEPLTEVEVRFEPIEGGTRVVLEHRGLDGLPPEVARTFSTQAWANFMSWFAEYAGRGA
jgi:uncharacterized protein YndB with AHSA1/START domain